MSLFIHKENQEILWKHISQTEVFHRAFAQRPQYESNEWFRNVIHLFYQESLRQQIESKAALTAFNRNVLGYMIQDLTKRSATKPEHPLLNDRMVMNNYQPPKTKEDVFYSQEFSQRQNDYNELLKKPEPPKVSFGETVRDEVITNMDELIQQQMRMREQMMVAPAQSASNSSLSSAAKIHIHNDESAKTVTWKEPVIELPATIPTPTVDLLNGMKTELGELRNQVVELRSILIHMYNIVVEINNKTQHIMPPVETPVAPVVAESSEKPIEKKEVEPTVENNAVKQTAERTIEAVLETVVETIIANA